jgi:hypothetical protein
MSRRPSHVPLAALGVSAAVLMLAACGSSTSTAGKTSTASAADNALNFSKCMREHGVKNFPNPETSGGRVALRVKAGPGGVEATPQTMEAAQSACKRFQPAEQTNVSPQEKIARQEAVLKFAKCMRTHGINVHASAVGGGVQIQVHPGSGGGGPSPESPGFQAAQKGCQGLLPGPRGGGAGGLSTSGAAGSAGPAGPPASVGG